MTTVGIYQKSEVERVDNALAKFEVLALQESGKPRVPELAQKGLQLARVLLGA
jgi:hypothetical protein